MGLPSVGQLSGEYIHFTFCALISAKENLKLFEIIVEGIRFDFFYFILTVFRRIGTPTNAVRPNLLGKNVQDK